MASGVCRVEANHRGGAVGTLRENRNCHTCDHGKRDHEIRGMFVCTNDDAVEQHGAHDILFCGGHVCDSWRVADGFEVK